MIRHSLNLESGLNDGLALPAVLAFAAAAAGEDDFVWWEFVLQDVTLGVAFGLICGVVAAAVATRVPEPAYSAFGLGVAFATYGLAVGLPPEGNGFIAVFVCAITAGIRRPVLRARFEHGADDIVEIVKLGVFVVFGSLLSFDGLFADGWAAVAIVGFTLLLARPIAIWIALVGARIPTDYKAFMAWFGPKGVATMTFALLVLGEGVPDGERIFNIAALCVFASILLHGLTDTPGAEWIARREEAAGRDAVPSPVRVS